MHPTSLHVTTCNIVYMMIARAVTNCNVAYALTPLVGVSEHMKKMIKESFLSLMVTTVVPQTFATHFPRGMELTRYSPKA